MNMWTRLFGSKSPESGATDKAALRRKLSPQVSKIEGIEIYFEPLGPVKMAMQSGAQVGLPVAQGIPAAIRTADQYLGMGGELIAFASRLSLNVQVVEEMSDDEWASFLSKKPCGQWTR